MRAAVSDNDPGLKQAGQTAEIHQLPNVAAELPDNVAVLADNVAVLPGAGHSEHLRIIEAVLFAASEPLDEASLIERLPDGADIEALLRDLEALYARRGVNLVRVAGKWSFRTAEDLAFVMRREATETKRLSRAALETLAIIAYHQPTTRAEIEDVRGVAVSKGTLDVLMEAGWIRIKGRRQAPGRPVTFGTTDDFLSHFGLETVKDLPGVDELKAAGLLRSDPPGGFTDEELGLESEQDEEEISDEEFEEFGELDEMPEFEEAEEPQEPEQPEEPEDEDSQSSSRALDGE
ncbi:MAG: SMC-Scp complex subunit ScpB [Rhizobiales bacterium]|nr:SMC-Scp complex subunit ScpB [Hyphomicrobiales bacterium]